MKKKNIDIKNKYREIVIKNNKKRINENTDEGIADLVDKYNLERAKKYNINIKKQDEKKTKEEGQEKATNLMIAFLERLKLFRFEASDDLDENALYDSEKLSQKYINKNKKAVENIHYQINYGVEKFYPDLISFNMPRILKSYPRLKRKELYEIFIQYKTLMKISIALNKSMKVLKLGLDFDTFTNGVPQMAKESEELAKKIFETINERGNNYLTWDEFMKGMLTIKSNHISDKIDMFFRVNIIIYNILDHRY